MDKKTMANITMGMKAIVLFSYQTVNMQENVK
jgi:hypothetical protein